MRALRYQPETGGVALTPSAPEPKPAPGDALVRTTLGAIDPADLRPTRAVIRPYTVGRQFVGVVERLSGDTRKNLLGKRVVATPVIACGACDLCRGGAPAHCRERTMLGSPELDGCLAELFTIPAGALVEVPDAVDDESALLAVPVASALHAARHVRLDRKAFVTIVGDGLVALLCAQIMARLNASVRLLGHQDDRLDVCEKWGVRHRRFHEAGRRADQDVVIECTGTGEGLSAAMGLLRPRSRLILKAAPDAVAPLDPRAIVEHEIEVAGSGIGSIPEAVAALASGQIETAGLAPLRISLASLSRAADVLAPGGWVRNAIAA